jgi:CBS domain-containing protein
MQQWTVQDVMTTEVLTVDYDIPPADVLTTMTSYDVSALAVVDNHDSVLGVITRTDVLRSIELRAPDRRSRLSRRRPAVTLAWTVRSAGQMMNAPALTVEPDATLAQAGRLMRERAVNRLLVTGPDRRLLGIVTAADLLKVYDRPDEVIRADVRQALATLPADDVAFDVRGGVVTVAGTVPDARIAALLPRLVRDVPGVTAIRSEVTIDPPATSPASRPLRPRHRPIGDWWPNRRPHPDSAPMPASAARG